MKKHARVMLADLDMVSSTTTRVNRNEKMVEIVP